MYLLGGHGQLQYSINLSIYNCRIGYPNYMKNFVNKMYKENPKRRQNKKKYDIPKKLLIKDF
jgi:hypothetical protein